MNRPDVQTFDLGSRLRGKNRYMNISNANKTPAENSSGITGMRFHFVGVGGIGMSGLARLLMKHKAIVSGSDQTPSDLISNLVKNGANIKIGHKTENLNPDTDAIVISAAIKQDNPELKTARQKGIKIYKYAEMLGELMNVYDGIAVSGTHGKSTTSGWLIHLLKQAGIDTNFIVGAEITQLGSSSGIADSDYFVAEACEYDRSFLNLKPKIACILNIEQDHLDYYKDEDEIVEAFGQFACGTKPSGVVIAGGQDPNAAKIIKDSQPSWTADSIRCETFGLDEKCNYYAKNIEPNDGLYSFDIYHNGNLLGNVRISLPGRHNVCNALAVTAMAANTGLEPERIIGLLGNFTGIDRRLMLKGRFGEITIIDDYAHHPTEIRASLAAIRQRYNPKRLWCVFQPHQYSRTRFLLNDFTQSFKLADVTIVPEIYFVRDSQSARTEINAQILVDRLQSNGTQAIFIDGFAAICDYLQENIEPGDVVVTMGAGDIWKVADELIIQRLKGNS